MKNNWRHEPASDNQKHLLSKKGLKFSDTITKGDASDLIGTKMPAEDDVIEILHFFKINGTAMNQTEARNKLDQILSQEQNRKKWNDRTATKDQKEMYKFFGMEIPKGLKFKDAEKVSENLMNNEAKWESWEQYKDDLDDRELRLDDLYEIIADYRDLYDCKKISKRVFGQIIQELEASGLTLEQLESEVDYHSIYKKAIGLKPDLVLSRTKTIRPQYKKKGSNLIWYAVLAFILWLLWTLFTD